KDSVLVKWTVPADLPYFQGHFPGQPVFPAVGIVDATLHALSVHHGSKLTLAGVPQAKFLHPILPGQTVQIEMNAQGPKEWIANWKDGSELLATLRIQIN